jgi:hypothetical protein
MLQLASPWSTISWPNSRSISSCTGKGHGDEELEEIEGDALVVVRLVAEEPAEDR